MNTNNNIEDVNIKVIKPNSEQSILYSQDFEKAIDDRISEALTLFQKSFEQTCSRLLHKDS